MKYELKNCREFMDLICRIAEDRIASLPYHTNITAKKICGDDVWDRLSPGEQKLAGKCIKQLVEEKVLPFDPVDTPHEYPLYYQRR